MAPTDPDQPTKPVAAKAPGRRGLLAGAALVTIAVSGYFMGLRQTGSAISMTRPVEVVRPGSTRDLTGATDVPVAVAYRDQDWTADGFNGRWETRLGDLVQPPAEVEAAAVPFDEKADALRLRASRRAWEGAPPVVPHPVAQESSASCLACHGEGLVVKDRRAPRASHGDLGGSCTQCHVPSHSPLPVSALGGTPSSVPLAGNAFLGTRLPQLGSRAWAGAPPTVPHSTLMRSDCMSCHGPTGLFAIRTPHPERQSCTQCHVSSATADQRFFVPAPPLESPPAAAPAGRDPSQTTNPGAPAGAEGDPHPEAN